MVKIIIRMKNEIILEKSLTVAFFCLSAECKVNSFLTTTEIKAVDTVHKHAFIASLLSAGSVSGSTVGICSFLSFTFD